MKFTLHSALKSLEKRYHEMEKAAGIALHIGLLTVALASAALLWMVYKAESAARLRELHEALPALVVSLPIVFGGAVALDWVLKGK